MEGTQWYNLHMHVVRHIVIGLMQATCKVALFKGYCVNWSANDML